MIPLEVTMLSGAASVAPIAHDTPKLLWKEAESRREDIAARWEDAETRWEEAEGGREEAEARLEEAESKRIDAERLLNDVRRECKEPLSFLRCWMRSLRCVRWMERTICESILTVWMGLIPLLFGVSLYFGWIY